MTLWQWLLARVQRPRARATIIPPPPYDEAQQRLDVAIARTQQQTRRLELDGSALADRIQRNARAGRDALRG